MPYQQTIQYLDSFINYEKKSAYPYKESFKLERIQEFLKSIGNPQDYLKCIHIAGTKGKGSVCAFCAYILKEAGYKVGLYTSPHLSDVRERIRILRPSGHQSPVTSHHIEDFEGMISQSELVNLVKTLKPKIDDYAKKSPYGPLSFFEVYTALAFAYFKEKNVDLAVLETGLGGRLDATNAVDALICGITSISYDHMNKLGNTLTEIATEKAGVIKSKKSPALRDLALDQNVEREKGRSQKLIVITAPQEDEVIKVIRQRCSEQDATLYEIGKDIIVEQTSSNIDFQCFALNGTFGKHRDLKIKLQGKHQLINAALAVSLIDGLVPLLQMKVPGEDIKKGLYNTVWPGRFEIISRSPLVVLDGAHNDASIKALTQTLQESYPGKNITFILGISRDKDIKEICHALALVGNNFIMTRADNPRAFHPQDIQSCMGVFKPAASITLTNTVKEALSLAKQKVERDGLIVVTGSLFIVAEARDLLAKKAI
jgi:dihydrofolate synthase/folylpolyglutamate synthase